jgi:hypothetical protein
MSVKLMGWQQVRSIFLALLSLLLLLLGLWIMGPLFVSNVGKLIDTITASPKLDNWIENIAKNYQFFVFLFSMFVICMGFTRWLGKRLWYQETISRRKQLKLPVASLVSSDPSAFSYSSLFQGGLIGLAIASYYFMFIFVSPVLDEDVLQTAPLAMVSPIALLAAFSLQYFVHNAIFSRKNIDMLTNSPTLIMCSIFLIAILVGCFVIEFVLSEKKELAALPAQILVTIVVCLCYSFAYGVSEGIKTADPALNYPLTSIEVMHGTGFEEAWLYERTDSDYRMVTKSGSNHIIPASNVKEIRGI